MAELIRLTKEGLAKLKKELVELKTVRRKELAARLEAAKELGDLSENADYQQAKEESAWVEGRVNELEDLISRAEIAAAPEAGVASIGSTVTTTVNNQTRVFSIVGATEADPAHGRISAESPIGKALMRGKAGDDVLVQTPAGPARYRIEKVE
ncbi:hypothetical protein A3B21_03675 [Candidatus Uhrbacteria bacterium RIFCSPLOWO2_01_FULL_47_24]|uniref:Transcription elongation factor GreA n=1 Tax=Candidatus Uhrbacteria bacterium RIFCSPLOWO2_01_FULL_47_24 TaxID=1802401 RepID=A0A1F7USL9_9BACT|nr:MAG: hypothetical protein A2753_04590 [Candidatus Uhrbacteria bacterium RIFCSPHIGHO2_01_FULL_47_11]OGL68896.1 MAG: hypothetical protein A3D58_03045 [Candidatus Uhrbacteria bacterium RIFCSPHIGHO2_02_FULL_46_47]OGL75293.1 MAG: hypothetical protein A3F52_04475 [Candidatus Uhrbacteria bacterium RIFCSPHIGHO2_12_FULL_47_11]OGL81290.1 MAG: hypothetical protein A3B21_03675 [Candidatus Uhrbacteria bacterium RIFCSPLOWO2_01_FULL_47_24]OGL85177.1 MAG: hypothetical protein A3J03_01890 [Candidatus Uhrbact